MSTMAWRGEGREAPEPADGVLECGPGADSDSVDIWDAVGAMVAEAAA